MNLAVKMAMTLLFIVVMFVCWYEVSSGSCIKQERESLLRLKASFIDSSNRLGSWNNGTDCCSWHGVGCHPTNGHVVKLDLRNYEYLSTSSSSSLVSNGVDSSLFELKHLNYLDLSGNSFNHTQIPDYLASMLELRYLNLSDSNFDGRIPRVLGNLTKLHVLDLKYSMYTNIMFSDDLGWVSRLSSLEYLDLSGVKLPRNLDFMHVLNTLPSLLSLKLSSCGLQNTRHINAPLNSSFLSKLQHLDLSFNKLEGPIPNFLRNMTFLRFINLSINRFNSSIPLWLGNLMNLVGVDLAFNEFTSFEGGLSSIVRNNCYLKSFGLSHNQVLRGDVFGSHENVFAGCKDYDLEELFLTDITFGTSIIPNWLGQLKKLKYLYLQRSSIYGPIPASLGNLSSLEALDISYNMLSEGIPTSFGKLLNLQYLILRENNLEGVIPESFGQLQSLKIMDFSKNTLKGVVSEIHFVNLSQLEYIYMNENYLLSFQMKHSWVPPFQLKRLFLRSTMGFGTTEFPRWIGTQKEMSYLNLFNTNILGPIPTWLRYQSLIFLDLSYNQITGSLQNIIDDQMPDLVILIISNAHINGSLPQSLCTLKNLRILIVSNNRLFGTIPSCLSTLNLVILDLSSNKITGVIPSSFQNLSNIEVMKLAKNHLEGEPLTAMRSYELMKVLDLEGNQFSGNIPSWVGKSLTSVQILNLRGNKFNGTIPSTLWLLPHLQILILADNKLEGNIPPNVGSFSASPIAIAENVVVCNSQVDPYSICYESYIGQIIKSSNLNYSYFRLYSMVNIDLSNNNLCGHIPSEITTIKGLFGLNLSHNNLSGTIPVEIGRMVSLESLDLSFNQLFGSIPNTMSSLNSLGVLQLSNNNFSGRIPREGHLSTFNDEASYKGNPYLCGDPISIECPNENSGGTPIEIDNFDDNDSCEEDKFEKIWFWIVVMIGYALGFWGVVGGLILKRSWRRAYFQIMDDMKDKIHVAILVTMTRLKQRMRRNNNHQWKNQRTNLFFSVG